MTASPQITTVFSINPKTNQPYIEIEMAEKIIGYHIAKFSKNLLNYKSNQMEDLVQDVLERLCSATYDPTKSSPKTFILMVAKSALGNIVKYEGTRGKDLESADFALFTGEDGYTFMATEAIGINNISPLDVILAKEFAEAFLENPPKHKHGRLKGQSYTCPVGFKGFGHGKSTKRKKLKPNA